MKKIVLVLGTRPEIIKFAPIVEALRKHPNFTLRVIASGQHRELAQQAFSACGYQPDIDLALMREDQTPNGLLGVLLATLEPILIDEKPDCVLVQGDTTTALGGALAAFHLKIPLGHIEAGLRTYNFYSPFPEEMNRSAISKLTTFHFCPTEGNAMNLKQEYIREKIFVVGNTIVDAVLAMIAKLESGAVKPAEEIVRLANSKKNIILVTGHRRENFDQPLRNLCKILLRLVDETGAEIIFPVHLNPNIYQPVHDLLDNHPGVHLVEPVDYPTLVYLMQRARLIISDSGGIQEEAPTLGTPVVVTRNTTERREGLAEGTSFLGDLKDPDNVLEIAKVLLQDNSGGKKLAHNPFGDGTSAQRIVTILERELR